MLLSPDTSALSDSYVTTGMKHNADNIMIGTARHRKSHHWRKSPMMVLINVCDSCGMGNDAWNCIRRRIRSSIQRATVMSLKQWLIVHTSNMMTLSDGNIFCVTGHLCGEFIGHPAQRPVTRSFDVFFDQRLNKCWVNNREAGDLRRHLPIMTSL